MTTSQRISRLLGALQLDPTMHHFLRVRLQWWTNRCLMVARGCMDAAAKYDMIEAERQDMLKDLMAVYQEARQRPGSPVTLLAEDSDHA